MEQAAQVLPYVAAPFTGGASLLASPLLTKTLGKGLKAPGPPSAQPPVTTESKAVQEASADAAQRRAKAKGLTSTILRGFLDQSPSAGLKQTTGS